MAKKFRVDISTVPKELWQETKKKLSVAAFMCLEESDNRGGLCAYIAVEEKDGTFPPIGQFKQILGLPDSCIVADITDQSLLW